MAITVEGLRTRLGIDSLTDDVLQLIIDDTLGSLRVLTGLKRFSEDSDGDIYAMCMDVYRTVGYGQKEKPVQIGSVKDKDQTVSFNAGGSSGVPSSAAGVIEANHKASIRRIRKLRW